MTDGVREVRVSKGEYYLAHDIGCPDFAAARANRERQKQGDISWWLWYERVVSCTPKGKRLPPGAPTEEVVYGEAEQSGIE